MTASFRHSALTLCQFNLSLQVTQCPLSVSGGDVKATANARAVLVFVAIEGSGAYHVQG